jgi:uncharacterized C2H2 Zn-finger protein
MITVMIGKDWGTRICPHKLHESNRPCGANHEINTKQTTSTNRKVNKQIRINMDLYRCYDEEDEEVGEWEAFFRRAEQMATEDELDGSESPQDKIIETRTVEKDSSQSESPGPARSYRVPDDCNLSFSPGSDSTASTSEPLPDRKEPEPRQLPGTKISSQTANEPQYQCERCSKRWKSARDLKNHQKAHVKRYACGLCMTTKTQFSYKKDLRRHNNSIHSGRRPFLCLAGCDKTFTRLDNMNRHLEKKHGWTIPRGSYLGAS